MKIAHISDIHFGAELGDMVPVLKKSITSQKPDLVIVSGDFTQNGTHREFKIARDFLADLDKPYFCIPGNHDVPRIDLVERLLKPYSRYKKYITRTLYPVFENEIVRIVGLNSARRALPHWNWANGAVSKTQLCRLKKLFEGCGDKYKICVLHHPLYKAEMTPIKVKVFGARRALKIFDELDIDLVLTGHVHHASVDVMNETIFVSASTAISRRTRMQNNGFNIIELGEEFLDIRHFTFKDDAFVEDATIRYKKNAAH